MAEPNGNGKVTERVILEQRRVIVLPADVGSETVQGALNVINDSLKGKTREKAVPAEAWTVCDQRAAVSKRASIVAHTGEPGTPDARPGTFKAVPVGNWKGGLVLKAPPRPLVMATELEE